MKRYAVFIRKDMYQTRFTFWLAISVIIFLQLGCFLLAHTNESGLATVLAVFVTYLSAFLLPVFYLQSLRVEWNTHVVYFWINSSYAGYPVLLSKLSAALLQTLIILATTSAATFGIYTFELHVIGGLTNIAQEMMSLLAEAYRMNIILLLVAIVLSFGLGLVFLVGKAGSRCAIPGYGITSAVLVVMTGSMLGGWFEWIPFSLPLGIRMADERLEVEYVSYSIGEMLILLLLALVLLAASHWLLKEKVQIMN